MINVQVDRNASENALSLLRRFNKRVQGAGIVPFVRSNRYKARNQSRLGRKRHTLNRMRRYAQVQKLIKLGKLQERTTRTWRHGKR